MPVSSKAKKACFLAFTALIAASPLLLIPTKAEARHYYGGGWGRGGWGWGGPRFGFGVYGVSPYYYSPGYYPPYYYAPSYYAPAYPYPQPAYAPPPPAPVRPVAAAPLPSFLRSYQVYFDFDKSNLSPAALQVIQQAADQARSDPSLPISVTGHTDTTGSSPYNLALSRRRSEAVTNALVADGVPADKIAAEGVGKSDLQVPTPNEVREFKNRRVTIVFAYPAAAANTVSTGTNVASSGCVPFQTTIAIEGRTEQAHGTACRQNDGSWKIVR